MATWCEELTHLKRPRCWEGLKAGEEGDDRGWNDWMASPTQWIWVWVSSRCWWWTGRPGLLKSMGSQSVGHDWATELNWTEWSSGFPYFCQFQSVFSNNKFMVWAKVSFQSSFCWLYRASPSCCKEYNQSDFGVDHLVMSMCRVFCVVGRGYLLWPACSLGKILLAFALLPSVFQGQICLLSRCFLTSYFCIPVPYNEKDLCFECEF